MRQPQPSFQDLYDEHAAGVRRLLHRMNVGDDLDDLVQETFVKIFHHQDAFEGRSALKTWIYSVAMNTARDHHRKRKRSGWLRLFEDEDALEGKSLDRPDHQISDRQEIQVALQQLSPKLRETMILYSLQDLELQDIAAILDIPLGTVKSRINEARSKLKAFQAKGE